MDPEMGVLKNVLRPAMDTSGLHESKLARSGRATVRQLLFFAAKVNLPRIKPMWGSAFLRRRTSCATIEVSETLQGSSSV
jgi:hypothetical protein